MRQMPSPSTMAKSLCMDHCSLSSLQACSASFLFSKTLSCCQFNDPETTHTAFTAIDESVIMLERMLQNFTEMRQPLSDKDDL